MELFRTIAEVREALAADRAQGLTVGFVPTMGALHLGHLSLVERAAAENDRVIASIFVNPTQFNDPNDLKNYPRTMEADSELLGSRTCHYLFAPEVGEIYPEKDTRQFQFGKLESVMEGAFRPGHFQGVAQVVSKLFDIVRPDRAYFGYKDFQQYSIICNMVDQLKLPVAIVPCPIVREVDGLAMSSRNRLLTPEHRAVAPKIYALLKEAVSAARNGEDPATVRAGLIAKMEAIPLLRLEYFDIVDERTLEAVVSWDAPGRKVGCIALYAGSVRLIDNIVFDL
ncbi:MAG: pantoate--beta-alanine ligase [Marinilabiliales bacterium]|nr:pantoate--beta-alanine ligase [Marinilabiliales bacterium]